MASRGNNSLNINSPWPPSPEKMLLLIPELLYQGLLSKSLMTE